MLTDKDSGAGVTLDIVQNAIHKGKFFSGALTFTAAANTSAYFMFRTAIATQEKPPHVELNIKSTGAGQVCFFEDATVSTNTAETAVVLKNHKRSSSETTFCTFAYAPTANISGEGTCLDTHIIGGSAAGPGGSGVTIGASNGTKVEYELKSATTYAVKFQNGNGSNTTNISCNVYLYKDGSY